MCQFSRLPGLEHPKPEQTYASNLTVENYKQRLERMAKELACYRKLFPGWLYSERHDMLVDAGGIGDEWA